MSISKKASITISFSWVFMIIVGAFFIFIAYNIIGNYQDVERQKLELEIQSAFRSDLATVGKSTGREQNSLRPLTLPFEGSLELECIGGEIASLNIDGRIDGENNYLRNYPVFMTYITEDRVPSTYIVVENYALPFNIVPLLSIVSTKNLIVFDNQSQIWSEFKIKLQEESSYSNLSYVHYNFSDLSSFTNDISNRAIDSITFVSDAQSPLGLNLDELNPKSQYIQINKTNQYDKYQIGEIIYVDNNFDDKKNIKFNFTEGRENSLAIQMMSILSFHDSFSCSYNLLYQHLIKAYEFYSKKSEIMAESADELCSARSSNPSNNYLRVNESLNDIITEIETYNVDNEITMFKNPEKLRNLLLELDSLYEKNIEQFNCRYIY